MAALFGESAQHSTYTRLAVDPGGANEVVLFKSCFPNSNLEGNPADPPSASGWLTVGHAKYVYNEILACFGAHPEKLFIVLTAPPVQDATYAANARAFNTWLVEDWLAGNGYTLPNVGVFDFYNVLTGPGSHHRYVNGAIEHVVTPGMNTLYYPSSPGDDHPNAAGSRKATTEFVPLLNVFYNRWKSTSAPAVLSSAADDATPTDAAGVSFTVTFSGPVTGVDLGDFALATAGLSGASVLSVSGSGAVYTVDVGTGSGSGTLRLDVLDDDSVVDAGGHPLGGVGAGNGAFTGGASYVVRPLALTVTSVGACDGHVPETSEKSGKGGKPAGTATTFRVGDDAANRQYRAILHFDTSALPDDAVVTGARLRVARKGTTGTNPFKTHQGLLVEMRAPSFGSAALERSDFQAAADPAAPVGEFGATAAGRWFAADFGATAFGAISRVGSTQLRLRFRRDDNNDRGADYIRFFSGDADPALRPTLTVQYFVP
jgi:hypothetical protein